jgi:hypothetical protein
MYLSFSYQSCSPWWVLRHLTIIYIIPLIQSGINIWCDGVNVDHSILIHLLFTIVRTSKQSPGSIPGLAYV